MPAHAIELLLTEDDDARIRELWTALADAGLPSQARHTGATNAPHLTVGAAVGIDRAVEQAAAESIGPLLPLPVEVEGVSTLGRGPYAVVLAVHPPERLQWAVGVVRAALGDAAPWTPHVTLARRVREAQIGVVLDLLSRLDLPERLTVGGLRRWNPDTGTVRVLAGRDTTPGRTDSCVDASR